MTENPYDRAIIIFAVLFWLGVLVGMVWLIAWSLGWSL